MRSRSGLRDMVALSLLNLGRHTSAMLSETSPPSLPSHTAVYHLFLRISLYLGLYFSSWMFEILEFPDFADRVKSKWEVNDIP